MATPAFFEHVPAIVLHDALAELLGAADDGLMRALAAEASREERDAFASAWQERVARIFAARRGGARLVRFED